MTNREVSQARLVLRPYTRSLNFNGSSDLATVPFTPSVNGWSLSYFIKTGNVRSTVMSWTTAATTDGMKMELGANPDTKLRLNIHDSTTVKTGFVSNAGLMLREEWKHVCVTFVPDSAKTYVNRVLINTDTSSTMSVATGQSFTLMRRSYVANSFSSGQLAELCFQNTTTPWTQAQIDDLYFRGIYPSGSSFYSLDGNVRDQNGGNDLTLTGTSYVTQRPTVLRTTAGNRSLAGLRTAV